MEPRPLYKQNLCLGGGGGGIRGRVVPSSNVYIGGGNFSWELVGRKYEEATSKRRRMKTGLRQSESEIDYILYECEYRDED